MFDIKGWKLLKPPTKTREVARCRVRNYITKEEIEQKKQKITAYHF